jgi:protein-tyrosine kinase
LSRVFDALKKTGQQEIKSPAASAAASPATLVDALEKEFRVELLTSARVQLSRESRLVFHMEPNSPGAERYRLLRLRLQAVRAEADVKTVLITSPGPGEGKSTLALNLAAALAEKRSQSVLLLDCDLRHPKLTSELGLKLPSGLTQCAHNDIGWQSVIWKIDPLGFYLLPAGSPTNNPAEILNPEWFRETKVKLASSFDWIIMDSPPTIPVVDTLSLKDHADAILLVARADHTERSAIDETIQLLGQDRILGVILNGVEKFERDYYEHYGNNGSTSANGKR